MTTESIGLSTASRRPGLARRQFIAMVGVGTLTMPFSKPANAQVLSLNDAINKAGPQRMLSQRAVKTYMALGQNILPEAAQKVLAASLALFDRQLIELKVFAPNADTKATYGNLETAWSELKAALVGKVPEKAGAEPVLVASAKVLQLAHQGTVQLEETSTKPSGKLVNMAGRQRMLSQRMAAYYLAASWGVQPSSALTEVLKAREEYVKAHAVLKAAPEATPAIKAELELAESQFTFFEIALGSLKTNNNDALAKANVFTTSERILQVMNNVTGMYEKVA
jgi:hypothetical protein